MVAAAAETSESATKKKKPKQLVIKEKTAKVKTPKAKAAKAKPPSPDQVPTPVITLDTPVRTGPLEQIFDRALIDSVQHLSEPAMKALCYGCRRNRPSQKDHDFCLDITLTEEEKVDQLYNKAYTMIEPGKLYHRWVVMAELSLDPELSKSELDYMRDRCEEQEDNDGCYPTAILTIVKLLDNVEGNLKLHKPKFV